MKTDKTEAYKYYLASAKADVGKAQSCLASFYYYGDGIIKNGEEAFYWYKKAAKHRSPEAWYNLAWMYHYYLGDTKENKLLALEWYKKSAMAGYAEAQNGLGLMYEQGEGVIANKTEALKWYKKSADQGYEYAQWNLRRLYKNDVMAHRLKALTEIEKSDSTRDKNNIISLFDD
ncbi:tetratricopeptide repeat protein [Lactococcus nasutitermitis]|uniref:Tetratricopeptide repeat protein n=1 Tax=Lactococcus nasutitermitis TaxID=1652957 RepID=A0ABV9JDX9_9LACT|nr:tetratricopeptide repeat protein [Lactococcus nasutitermitis]